jgi:hypothetical protein
MESSRLVRYLLIKGANTTIINKNGQTPIELVTNDIKTPYIANDVRRMLGPPGILDCLMLSTPHRKIIKRPTTLLVFCLMFTIIEAIWLVNIYPHL